MGVVSPNLIQAATDTYNLEMMVAGGLSTDALGKAISASLEAHEKAILDRVAIEAEAYAVGVEADEDNPDFAVALRWFAHKLRNDLGPPVKKYVPALDDVVEVTITGAVVTWTDPCEACGSERHGDFHWSVLDDTTGDEYFFRKQPGREPRVRLLLSGTQENPQ